MIKTEKDFGQDVKKLMRTVEKAKAALNHYDIPELRNVQNSLEKYINILKENKKLDNYKNLDKNLKNAAKEALKEAADLLAEVSGVVVKLTTPRKINSKNV